MIVVPDRASDAELAALSGHLESTLNDLTAAAELDAFANRPAVWAARA